MDPRQEELEKRMAQLCRQLDVSLEENFGSAYPRHPNRMAHGSGSNPVFDGLFSTTAAFTLGYGSVSGRGYLINIDIRTLQRVSDQFRQEVLTYALSFLNEALTVHFPERKLDIIMEGRLLKLVGDFSLN